MLTTLPRLALFALLLTAGSAYAQNGQSMTQPSANLNQSQTLTTQSQQPGNLSGPGATVRGQQLGQPSANENQPQAAQNQGQNSPASGTGGSTTTGTGPSR